MGIWLARNKTIFEGLVTPIAQHMNFVLSLVCETSVFKGHVKNTILDLYVLRTLGVHGIPTKTPKIISIN